MLAFASGAFVELLTPGRTIPGPSASTGVPGEAGLPPDRGAEPLWDRPAGAWLAVKDELTVIFCHCQSALMHQHRHLHHKTSSRERLQGATRVTVAFPLGCLLPDPDPGAACPAGKGQCHFWRQTAISRRRSRPPGARRSSGVSSPAGRGSRFCQAVQRPCQLLHLP